jgi:uncharacterized protein YdbL (DUF1318 family)
MNNITVARMRETFLAPAAALMLAAALLLATMLQAHAQANMEANTPAINTLKKSIADRHKQLMPYYTSGAVGIAHDGSLVVRDASVVPLPKRGAVSALVAAENADRASLYKELARANGKPEWEGEIRNTFAQRWIDKAQAGWYVQNAQEEWVKK